LRLFAGEFSPSSFLDVLSLYSATEDLVLFQVPLEKCWDEPVEKCWDEPRQKCWNEPDKKCWDEPRQHCGYINKKVSLYLSR
jgi:hypothetical protein